MAANGVKLQPFGEPVAPPKISEDLIERAPDCELSVGENVVDGLTGSTLDEAHRMIDGPLWPANVPNTRSKCPERCAQNADLLLAQEPAWRWQCTKRPRGDEGESRNNGVTMLDPAACANYNGNAKAVRSSKKPNCCFVRTGGVVGSGLAAGRGSTVQVENLTIKPQTGRARTGVSPGKIHWWADGADMDGWPDVHCG